MLRTQRALWHLRTALPDPSALNLAFGLLLDGPFDQAALAWTLQELVRRHEPLRSACTGPADAPAATVIADVDLPMDYDDLSAMSGDDRAASVRDRCREAMHVRLDAPPLVRAHCLLLEPDRHLVLLIFNHLAVDGWALELFGREAEQLYAARLARAEPALRPLPAGQIDRVEDDWAAWRRGPRAQAELRERRRELAALDIRAIHPFGSCEATAATMRRRVLAVPHDVFTAWRTDSTKAGLTLFPALLAAVAIALCRHFELREVVLGALVANRHSTAAQAILGAHYDGSALRLAAAEGTPLADVMTQVVSRLFSAISHKLDIGTVAGLLGESAGAQGPLAPRCLVVMDRHPLHRLALEDVTITPISTLAADAEQLRRDLDVPVAPGGDLVIFLRHAADSAAVTVFWSAAAASVIDRVIEEIAQTLKQLGGGLQIDPTVPEPVHGFDACMLDAEGWTAVVPAVDALSPLPWFTSDTGAI